MRVRKDAHPKQECMNGSNVRENGGDDLKLDPEMLPKPQMHGVELGVKEFRAALEKVAKKPKSRSCG